MEIRIRARNWKWSLLATKNKKLSANSRVLVTIRHVLRLLLRRRFWTSRVFPVSTSAMPRQPGHNYTRQADGRTSAAAKLPSSYNIRPALPESMCPSYSDCYTTASEQSPNLVFSGVVLWVAHLADCSDRARGIHYSDCYTTASE